MSLDIPASRFYPLFLWAWKQQTVHRLRQMVEQSKLMLSVITGFVIVYWAFFTWVFYRGLYFVVYSVPGLGDILMARLFYLLFALIFVMLVTSSAIVGYGVYFKNRETAWMQTLPISHARLFRWKFVEASLLASWAFVFLSGPLLLAYGILLKLPWWFGIQVLILYIPFSILANAVGAYLILVLVRMWHSRWGRRIILTMATLALAWSYAVFKPIDVNALREAEIVPLMNTMLRNTRVVASPALPSYWLASSVIGLGEHLWAKPLFFFAVTLSYALLVGWLVLRHSGAMFYEGASAVQDRRLHGRVVATRRFVSPLVWSGRMLIGWMRWLEKPVRCILMKDWITFWRDTAQWSQFAIFFGLLGFYFMNIRNLRYQLDDRFWVSVVAFLNLASLGLILATLTTRFVFPQFSLEGRRLWLVGMAPVSLRRVVWGKFWASAVGSCAITVALMFFSFSSLQLEAGLRWAIGFTVVMMSIGLSGISVGTGVLFPNMKQANAAQIVSGFGGTFCLILSLAYVACTVVVVALPMHVWYMARTPLEFRFTSPVGLIYTITFVASIATAFVPMRLAEKKLDQIEL